MAKRLSLVTNLSILDVFGCSKCSFFVLFRFNFFPTRTLRWFSNNLFRKKNLVVLNSLKLVAKYFVTTIEIKLTKVGRVIWKSCVVQKLLQITSNNTMRDSSDTSPSVSYTFYQQKTFHRKKTNLLISNAKGLVKRRKN